MRHQISSLDIKSSEDNQDTQGTTTTVTKVKPLSVNTQDAKILVEILQIPTSERKAEHIKIMQDCLRKVKFLQSYQDSQHYGEVLRNLELEVWNLDHILFRQGDHADKFYIILNGVIGLYIRTQNDVDMVLKVEDQEEKEKEEEQQQSQDKMAENGQLSTSRNKGDNQNKGNQGQSKIQRKSIEKKLDGNQSVNLLGVGVREVARLESGDAFGELGLLFNENRTATAVCLDSTNFLVLKKDIFEKYLSQSKNAKISVMVDFYTNMWQMRDMEQKEILKLATKTTLTQCAKNTIIIKQGEKPKGLFFVRNGIVKLITTLKFRVDSQLVILDDYSDPSAEEIRFKRYKTIDVQLDDIGNGNLFADYEVFQDQEIAYTAITTTNCDILTITLQDLKASVPHHVFQQFTTSIKHYPSSDKIKRQYIENIMWNNYKNDIVQSFNNDLVNQLRQANILSHRLPFLPKIRLNKYEIYDEVKNSQSTALKQSENRGKGKYPKSSNQQTLDNIEQTINTESSISPEKSYSQRNNILNQNKNSLQHKFSKEYSPQTNQNKQTDKSRKINDQNKKINDSTRDKQASLFGEVANLNELEHQEDYLKSLLLKQTNQLQNKSFNNENRRNNSSNNISNHNHNNYNNNHNNYNNNHNNINNSSYNNNSSNNKNNNNQLNNKRKEIKQIKNIKEKSSLFSSKSANHLLQNQHNQIDKQNLQNMSLLIQNKLIDDCIQQTVRLEDNKSKQKNSQIEQNSLSLKQNLKSQKYILPKINKQSKVSLLANEIY